MEMKYGVNDLTNIVVGQTGRFIDILRLKLRILGFSNKRSGLMTKLGEAAFNAMEAGLPVADDADAVRLVGEIREAGNEITSSENEINLEKDKGREERREFKEKGAPAKEAETPDE